MSVNQQNYEIIDDRNQSAIERFWMIRENEYFLDENTELFVKLSNVYTDFDSESWNAFCINDNKLASFQSGDKVTRLENVEIRYK